MARLAIIPARGGSKRIPHKNVRSFLGKPILYYSISAAIQSGCFDEVMVSTDDPFIAETAHGFGATIPFLRSPKTSDDHAGILEVLEEVVGEYRNRGRSFASLCCLLPTAPLIRIEDILRGYDLFSSGHFDSSFPVVRFSYPILRALQLTEGRAAMCWPENYDKRSQDLPPAFHDAGQFYWIDPVPCFAKKRIFTDNSGAFELPEALVQDIDTEDDWKLCELKYRLFHP